MKTFLNLNKPFFICLFFWFMILAGFIIWQTNALVFLYINRHYSPLLDVFFINLTHLGDGNFGTLVAVCLCFVRLRLGLISGAAFVITGLMVQLLKRFFDMPRPRAYFEALHEPIRLIENLQIHSAHSFPSGHSATAFGVFAFLAFIVGDKRWGAFFACLAALVAFSRVYLSQHFPQDILVGGVLGVVMSGWFYMIFEQNKTTMLRSDLLELPLHRVFRKKK